MANGNPDNHFHVRRLGVQYLLHNPEQFIESNTDHSWQRYLNNMSCQGTWADAIIIQAVANCPNLSIHIAEKMKRLLLLLFFNQGMWQEDAQAFTLGTLVKLIMFLQ